MRCVGVSARALSETPETVPERTIQALWIHTSRGIFGRWQNPENP